MPLKATVLVVVALGFVFTVACTIKVVNVGQKTAFERQLVGTYDELDDELALVASVRAGKDAGPMSDSGEDLRARAVAARRRQLFNRDDILELKQLGCLGESLRGTLAARDCEAAKDRKVAQRKGRMLRQENQDRMAIIELAIQLDNNLTPTDIPVLQKVYARLMRTQARKGDWLQNDDKSWVQVK